jgi:flagellar L-ring protein FlgH
VKSGRCFLSKVLVLLPVGLAAAAHKQEPPKPSPLDLYIEEATHRNAYSRTETPGAIWSPSARLADLARDPIATNIDDVITIVVADRATAEASGATTGSRKSQLNASITALGGTTRATGPWANLGNVQTQTQLNGQGTTSRQTNFTTTLTGRVTHVLPNGFLVVESQKAVTINSEQQVVAVRGIVRPFDISPYNTVRSDQIAQLEVKMNGKGVVNDFTKRPFILYRILLGLLPF